MTEASLVAKGWYQSADGQWHKPGARKNLPTPQCSNGISQSGPDSTRPVKVIVSAGQRSAEKQEPRRTAEEARKSASATGASGCTTEKQLQEQIANYLRLHDIWFSRSRMDRRTTTAVGTPDFLLAFRGRPIALEAKVRGQSLREEQIVTKARMETQSNGWEYYIVNQLEDVRRALGFIKLSPVVENHPVVR